MAPLSASSAHSTCNMEVNYKLIRPDSNSITYRRFIVEKGGYSSDGKVVWAWNSNDGLSFYRVFQSYHQLLGKLVTKGRQLETSGTLLHDKREYLLLAFNDGGTKTLLLVVSMATGSLKCSIEVPLRVSALSCVSHMTSSSLLFNQSPLDLFSGTVACGCSNGCVIFINLALGHTHSWPRPRMTHPRHIKLVQFNVNSLNARITQSITEYYHLSLEINTCFIKSRKFQYHDAQDKKSFDDASVTAMHHVPLAGMILIGYSFGGFQLYGLINGELLFSSHVNLRRLEPPITHFILQEPDDDPRPFLYIWTARNGPEPNELFGSSPSVTLHRLGFEKKLDSSPIPYQGFATCITRYNHLLWPWHNTSAVLIDCFSIGGHRAADNSDSSNHDSFSKLVAFMCRGIGEESGSGLMVLFDLNGWYQAQCPPRPLWSSIDKPPGCKACPFLSLYQLSYAKGQLIGGIISSVSCYLSPSPQIEQHNCFDSYTLTVRLLGTAGNYQCEYVGVQSEILSELSSSQANIMTKCDRYSMLCHDASLHTPFTPNIISSLPTTKESQQHYLMSVCLHYNLTHVLKHVVETLSTLPGYSLSLKCFTSWASEAVESLVAEKDSIVKDLLMNRSSGRPDKATSDRLQQIGHQLSILVDVMSIMINNPDNPIQNESILTSYYVADIHRQISKSAYWCVQSGLLPHSKDIDSTLAVGDDGMLVFPTLGLIRRYELLQGKKSSNGLAVNELIKELTFDEGVAIRYPPPDINVFLNVAGYPKSMAQQVLLLYMLLDISTPPGDITLAESYSKYFNLDVLHLAVDIWHIDHSQAHSLKTLDLLADLFPSIFSLHVDNCIDNDMMAEASYCLFERTGFPLLRLRFFVASGSLRDALTETCSGYGDQNDLMKQFVELVYHCEFRLAYNHYQLMVAHHCEKLLKMQLTLEQLDDICGVLCDKGGSRAIELVLRLLIVNHRHIEAIALAKEREREGGPFASALIKCSHQLPSFRQAMCSSDLLGKLEEVYGVQDQNEPVPLSSIVAKSKDYQFSTHADLIYAVIQKMTEIKNNYCVTPFRTHQTSKVDSCTPSKVVSSLPFVSSPHPLSRSLAKSGSRQQLVATPGIVRTDKKTFVEKMENLKLRMALLNAPRPTKEEILTPLRPMALSLATPFPPVSILKSKENQINLSTADKKLRFQLEDSMTQQISDDSDSFFSMEGSPPKIDDSLNLGVVKAEPNIDHIGSDVVIDDGDKKTESFVASADDDDDDTVKVTSMQLSSIFNTSSLVRGPISFSSPQEISRPSVPLTSNDKQPADTTPLFRKPGRFKGTPKKSASSSSKTSAHSSVMVPMTPTDYKFSPPTAVAPPPVTPIETPSTSSFVYSPPLLRSASREAKNKQLLQYGRIDPEEATPLKGSTKKRMRTVKGPQKSTSRRPSSKK